MFILYNFVKQAVLGLHTHFKLTVSPFYFPHDRVTNLGVMFVVRDKVIKDIIYNNFIEQW